MYKRYNSYKESGFVWLGEIPSHWEESIIKALTRVVSRKNRPNEPLLSVYRDYGVILKSSRDDNYNRPGQDLSAYKYVKPTNLVLNKMKTWQGSLGVSEFHGIVSPAYITCELDISNVFPRYLHYLLRCRNYIHEYNRLSYGVRTNQWDMRYDDFKKIPVFLPSKQEQRTIAKFLDRKTVEIDRFIANKEKLIALLNKQKAATINRAVTKGINPDAKLKPSGVAWLGEIPKDWEVRRLKYELESLNERRIPLSGPERGAMKNKRYDYYGASGIIDKVDDYIFDEPLLLIAEDGANLLLRNLPLAIIATGKYWVNNHAHILRPYRGNLYFFAYLLESMRYDQYISGSAQPKLTQDRLANIKISVPPVNEQWQIINALNRETEKIDAAVAKAQKEIYLIRKYHQALISEAVTGKIDVRKTA